MVMASGSAMATQGDVQFFGNVSATTCDVVPEVNGSVVDLIQLGTVTPGGTGTDVDISFKATNAQNGGCTGLAGKTASFAWTGNLTADGIGAQSGLAQDAYVILTPANGQDSNAINSANNVTTFEADKATGDGFQFTAKLKGGNTPGDLPERCSLCGYLSVIFNLRYPGGNSRIINPVSGVYTPCYVRGYIQR